MIAAFRRFLTLGLVLAALGVTAAQAAESRFFSQLSDIPLMPGMVELVKDSVVFDKPEGRIVEASAATQVENQSQINAFYNSTLPQLGWVSEGEKGGIQSFLRQNEALTFSVEVKDGVNIVHFGLSPHP